MAVNTCETGSMTQPDVKVALFPTNDLFSHHKIEIISEEPCDKPQALLFHSSNDDTYRAIHAFHEETTPGLGCHIFKNVRLVDGVNNASANAIAQDLDLVPAYWRAQIDRGVTGNLQAVAGRPTRIIDEPALSLMSLGYLGYGHWWLDILPRLWLHQQLFSGQIAKRTLVPNDLPDYGRSLLLAFGLDEKSFEYFSPRTETLFCRTLIAPSLLHSSYTFHSTYRLFIRDAAHRLGGAYEKSSLSRKLFVSRRQYLTRSAGEARTLENEPELMDMAVARGYEVVYPEDLDWSEKVRTFASARVVLGEFGSSLHHSIFSAPGARVGAIGLMSNAQSTLGTVCGHRNLFIRPQEIVVEGVRRMHVSAEAFDEALRMLDVP